MQHMRKLKILLRSNYFYLILIIFLGIYCVFFTKLINYESVYNLNETKLKGKIIDYNIDGNKLSMIIKGKEKVKVTYFIKSNVEKSYLEDNLLLGANIELTGTFFLPICNTIPNTFNYKKYLYNKKIYRLFTVDSYKLNDEVSLIYKTKNFILKRINANEQLSAYFKTFILGDKREISNEEYSNYQTNGVSHLLAISGMHIGLFSGMLLFILKLFKLNDKTSFGIVFLFMSFYAFLTGFPASIMRALVFMLFLNLNKIYGLKISNIKCLFLTIFSIVLFSPFIIYDLGFQYSVITVLGLLLCSDYIKGNYILKLFKTSIIAFIFSFPLTIYNFYEINLLSPIFNLLFVPFVSFIVYPLILLNFLLPFLTNITLFILNIMNVLNTFNAAMDFFIINFSKLSFCFIVILYFLIIIFNKTKRKLFIVIICILLLSFKFKNSFDTNGYVYFLDVGQGDSAVVITPLRKEVIMIDTGGVVNFNKETWQQRTRQYSISYNTIIFLKSLGISKLDVLVLSHGDYDHLGEAKNLVENFNVEKVIFNCGEFNELEQELIEVLDKKKIPYYSCVKELNIDDNKLYFLNNKDYGNENDNSSVIYTELNNYKFLFMGDAGVEVEEDLIQKYNLKNIDVLKVGHHGSKTSSSKNFINAIEPKCSLVSVGKNNRYGHPNDNVLENLEDSKIYRTDQDGSIMFKIKNNKLKIEISTP